MTCTDLDPNTARYITPDDPEWPSQLDALGGNVPDGLWVLGTSRLNDLVNRAVAVTGARASTAYGDTVANGLGHDLAREGYAVVNGGGYGIDAAALRGALSAQAAQIIVVQANGLDCLSPAGHIDLLKAVVERGGLIVTEYELGEHLTRTAFLDRARLIAALTQGSVVIEGSQHSCAREVTNWASSLGRAVLAVPGPITSAISTLPHQLIQEGLAVLVTTAADVIEALEQSHQQNGAV